MMRKRFRDERGQGLVEFALVSVPLLAIIAVAVQAGVYFYREITLNDAVRAAARTAMTCRYASVDPQVSGNNAANGIPVTWTGTGSTCGSVNSTCPPPSTSDPCNVTVTGTTDSGKLDFPILNLFNGIVGDNISRSVTVVVE